MLSKFYCLKPRLGIFLLRLYKVLQALTCSQLVKANAEAQNYLKPCKKNMQSISTSFKRDQVQPQQPLSCMVSVTPFYMHSINAAITGWHSCWNKTRQHKEACTLWLEERSCCCMSSLFTKERHFSAERAKEETHQSQNIWQLVPSAVLSFKRRKTIMMMSHSALSTVIPGFMVLK